MRLAYNMNGLRHLDLFTAMHKIQEAGYDAIELSLHQRHFANLYGVIPAPESSHALAAAIKRALYAKKMKKKEVIVLCLSGCGVLDMQAYIEGGR